jgi:hypothetical protein
VLAPQRRFTLTPEGPSKNRLAIFPGKLFSFSFILTQDQRPSTQERNIPKIAQDRHLPNFHRAMLLPVRRRMPEFEHLNPRLSEASNQTIYRTRNTAKLIPQIIAWRFDPPFLYSVSHGDNPGNSTDRLCGIRAGRYYHMRRVERTI